MNGTSETPRITNDSADNTYQTLKIRDRCGPEGPVSENQGRRHDILDECASETRQVSVEALALRQLVREFRDGLHGDKTIDEVVKRRAAMEGSCNCEGVYTSLLSFFT